jgi:malate dehydrogenase
VRTSLLSPVLTTTELWYARNFFFDFFEDADSFFFQAQLAKKFNVAPAQVHNVAIWGNHSSTQYPCANHGYYVNNAGEKVPFTSTGETQWFHTDFLSTVQKRGAAIIAARKLSSAFSAANAVAGMTCRRSNMFPAESPIFFILDHIHDWVFGTPEGSFVSMAVAANGKHYGIKEGIIFSFPVHIKDGKYEIVDGLELDDFSK